MSAWNKLTQKEVLKRFKNVHGDEYDYSLVEYVNTDTKVSIICKKDGHGVFEQTPNMHHHGQGCPKCGLTKGKGGLTQKEVLKRFKKVHGDEYDYSLFEYVNTYTKISIICKKDEHGVFEQTPYKHFIGRGCPKCGNIKKGNSQRKSTEDFISEAKEVHPDKNYGYEKVFYKGDRKKVIIICPMHGDFNQIPSSHLVGSGCPDCGLIQRIEKRKLGIEEFIKRSNVKHNNLYGYEKVEYVNTNTNVIIICPLHGEFKKTPSKHLQGQGCPQCAIKNRKKPVFRKSTKPHNKISFEEFVKRANLKYENKFSYRLKNEEFNLSDEDCLIVICETHGEIQTPPRHHLYDNFVCEKCKYENEFQKFESLMEGKHQNKYDISNVGFKNWITKIELECEFHGKFSITPAHLKEGKGCRECGIIKRAKSQSKPIDEFISQANEVHDFKYDYSKSVYNGARRNLIIICKIHGEFNQTPDSHLGGSGCLKCGTIERANKQSITLEEFLSRSHEIHGEIYDYSKVELVNTSTKVEIICRIHGFFFQDPEHHILRKHGCPRCVNKREGELAITLSELGIVHRQYKIENKRYDFYLPEYNVIIERDGEQHYRGFWQDDSKTLSLDYQIENDRIKTELAERHGHKLYRIPYWLDEEDIRIEISNILKGNPTYPSIPNIEHNVSQPKPRK
jgi:very-short-patch-repair endonuclease